MATKVALVMAPLLPRIHMGCLKQGVKGAWQNRETGPPPVRVLAPYSRWTFLILNSTHIFIFNNVQHGATDGTADRISAKRVEVFDAALAEAVGNLRRRDHGGQGMTITLMGKNNF